MRLSLRKQFLHIRLPAIDASISPTAGIEIPCTLDTRLGAAVANMPYYGLCNGSKRVGDDTCGCATRGLRRENRDVRSSNGPSSMMTAIRCGIRRGLKKMRQLWSTFQRRSNIWRCAGTVCPLSTA